MTDIILTHIYIFSILAIADFDDIFNIQDLNKYF